MTKKIKALLIDLEGTLYFKDKQLPGVAEVLSKLQELGLSMKFLTNTDSKTTNSITRKLDTMGFSINEADIFTPITAAIKFLESQKEKNSYFLLSENVKNSFIKYAKEDEKVDYVIIGDFRDTVNYETLNIAFQHIMAGSELIALQKGKYFIRDNGYNLDTGSFVKMLEYSSGKKARVLRKPSSDFFYLALNDLGVKPNEALVIGDDMTTDILGAHNTGIESVLVKTGKYNFHNMKQLPIKPNHIINSIVQLPALLINING